MSAKLVRSCGWTFVHWNLEDVCTPELLLFSNISHTSHTKATNMCTWRSSERKRWCFMCSSRLVWFSSVFSGFLQKLGQGESCSMCRFWDGLRIRVTALPSSSSKIVWTEGSTEMSEDGNNNNNKRNVWSMKNKYTSSIVEKIQSLGRFLMPELTSSAPDVASYMFSKINFQDLSWRSISGTTDVGHFSLSRSSVFPSVCHVHARINTKVAAARHESVILYFGIAQRFVLGWTWQTSSKPERPWF